jgi:hypothetical protein
MLWFGCLVSVVEGCKFGVAYAVACLSSIIRLRAQSAHMAHSEAEDGL